MESATLHPTVDKRIFVRRQLLLPTAAANDNVAGYCFAVGHKLAVVWTAAEASLVKSVNQSAGLLKFHGEEISRADVDRSALDAVGIVATAENLIAPEVEARLVRFAAEKIEI